VHLPLFSWRYQNSLLFRDVVSISGYNLISFILAVFEKGATLCFGGHLKCPPIFGTGMFIFTDHRPVINKLLNTKWEWSPSSTSGATEEHIYACMHTYIHKHIYTYIHKHIYTYIHACMHTYTHACIHTYINTCINTHMLTYTHACIHTYIHTYIHTHTLTYAHTHVHAYMLT
jgi:hypothetical protein